MKTDRVFSETDFSDADMLVLPGGMPGTKYLGEHQPLTGPVSYTHLDVYKRQACKKYSI